MHTSTLSLAENLGRPPSLLVFLDRPARTPPSSPGSDSAILSVMSYGSEDVLDCSEWGQIAVSPLMHDWEREIGVLGDAECIENLSRELQELVKGVI